MARAATKSKTPAATSVPLREWPWFYWLGASFLISIVVFSRALNGGFVFDDLHLPFADPHAGEMPAGFWIGGARPVLTATYWANFLMAGTQPFAYHVTNLVVHAATAVLMFFIFERTLGLPRAGIFNPAERRSFALFGAALFLLHPLQTEAVDYIAGRSELVSGFFFAAAWLVFLRGFEKRTSAVLALAVCGLGGLAVLSKESAISLPGVLLLTDSCFGAGTIGRQIRKRFNLYALFLIGGLAGIILILRSLTSDTSAGFSAGIKPFDYALTQCRSILTYLRLFFIPAGQNADWQLRIYHSLGDGAAAAYLAGLVLLVALVVWLYKRERLIAFGLAAFLVMLAPTSSFVPIRDALAERRMYLPIAGLILALLGAVSKLRFHAAKLRFNAAWWRTAAVVALVLCAALSWRRSEVWASDFNLWSDSVSTNPGNMRAHFGLGSAMMVRGDCAGAAGEFSAARSPAGSKTPQVSEAEVLWNLASAYECSKNPSQALTFYRSFAAVEPTAAAYEKIGFTEARLGHSDEALSAFDQALKLNPKDAEAYAYRGMVLLALGNRQGEADLRRALELDPGNQIASQAMARLAAGR